MEFQILGPLEVRDDVAGVALGTGKQQRALLAILLIHANELVASDRLVEELWPEPPRTAANALQVYVGKLRRALEPARERGDPAELLLTQSPGYVLRIGPDDLDAHRFERLLTEGRKERESSDYATAAARLGEALELWRGPALADFTYDPFAQAEIARLEELRLDAIEERIDVDLALGNAADLIGELQPLVKDHPLRERLSGQLMLALYRSGRQADALEAYRQTREVLDEQLGLTPSPPLERLQTAILCQEPALEVSTEAATVERSATARIESISAPSEARKAVTVLTVRVQGARGVDPEALGGVDERGQAAVARAVARYGGTITSRFGRTVIAVFGVPRVHEDDAFRAVSAALEIRDAQPRETLKAGHPIGAGIGVVTGEVLVSGSGVGSDAVVGEAITAAGELQESAAPGEILLGRESERLVRGRATTERVETAMGPAWRLLDLAHERPAVGSLKTPLVGREAEVAQVLHAFEQVARDRTLRMLTILGPAGIGKSRLAQELASLAADRATALVGRCVPYGEGITFWPLREIVDELTAVGSSSGHSRDGREARRLLDELRDAIGDVAGAGDREEIFWIARSLLEELARERPLIVFFEDVHWAEHTFLDLVEYLVDRVLGSPILVVCIARPELLEQRPGWRHERSNASAFALERLPDPDCKALIANLAGGLAPGTRARVLEIADGNPLFIEQLVAMLAERGDRPSEIPIPPTIAALLSARLDRLGPGVRAAISRAAVAGKEFSLEAVVELLPDDARRFAFRHLKTLVRKELIEPASEPDGGESYRFRHILIQQAAYGTTPKRVRAELHEHLATWISDPELSGVAEHSEIVGYHLEQAFHFRAELGAAGDAELELARRAGHHLAAAGQRAFQRGDMPATANLLRRAARLSPVDGEAGLAALPELGYALFEIGEVDEASAVLADGEARARAAGDRQLEWRIAVTAARVEMYRDPEGIDLESLAAQTETAIEVLGEFCDGAGLARAWMVLSDLHWSKGRLRGTSEAAVRAAEHARGTGNRREVGWALGQIALCAIHGPTSVEEGLRRLERMLAEEPENRTLDANLSGFVTVLEAMNGDFARARRHIEQSRTVARDLGLMWQAAVQELLSGYVELLAGDPVAAEHDMRSAGELFREIGEGWFLSTVVIDLPRAVYEQGRYEDAFSLLEAVEESPAPTDREWQIKRRGIPARLLARRGRFEEAEKLAREGVALAAGCEFLVLHADVLLDLAEVLELAGRKEEAAATAAEAVSLCELKGNVASARSARRTLGGLAAEGR